jgi:hypothetical protein
VGSGSLSSESFFFIRSLEVVIEGLEQVNSPTRFSEHICCGGSNKGIFMKKLHDLFGV